ncbi:MAG: hypothetical protein LBK70_02770 [Clostridiales bacterium]|jgi:hypothetical protein|nr:hypothetical protein [Clostridiales bacterium]
MILNKEAETLWRETFGNNSTGRDFAGLDIHKGAYGDSNSKYGWNIDHINPMGSDSIRNKQCCSIAVNGIKEDKQSFSIKYIDGTIVNYQVKKVNNLNKDDQVAKYNYRDKDYVIVILD